MKKIVTALCFAAVLLLVPVFAHAETTDEEVIRIYDAEGLAAIADNPSANYLLMNDIDMTGLDWTPLVFSGSFDGAGHSILNLKITKVNDEQRLTYDGNWKSYPTKFSGFFAILDKASVKNLNLVGLDIFVDIDENCMVGGLAGYADNSEISGCSVEGSIRLDVFGKMFGVAGVASFGYGTISDTKADVTLVNIDKDHATKDEEFLGGINCVGYFNILNCEVKLHGYISDHGYVHSGGVIGMNMHYPEKVKVSSTVSGNKVEGDISFFEDNKDRRAYCAGIIGENLNTSTLQENNSSPAASSFRKEVKAYDKDLLPHYCEVTDDSFTTEVIEAGCSDFGYSLLSCKSCGYAYKTAYTLKAHKLSDSYDAVVEPTLESVGLGKFTCSDCGAELYKEVPMLTPTPLPTPTPEPTPTFTPVPTPTLAPHVTAPSTPAPDTGLALSGLAMVFIFGIIIVSLLIVIAIILAILVRKKEK